MAEEFTWPLAQETPGSSSDSSAAIAVSGGTVAPSARRRGLLRPFQRDQKNDFALDSGDSLRRSRIGQVLGTELGELEHDMSFGSRVRDALQRPLDETTEELTRFYVEDAIERCGPTDVRITRVALRETSARNGIEVAVFFVPVDARGRQVGAEDSATRTFR